MLGVSTTTMLFSDIQGSTALLQRLGNRYGDVLERQRVIMRAAIAAHDGTEQGTEGDSFFVTFDNPSAAVAAAVDAQRDLQAECWADGIDVRVRMGVHLGEVAHTAGGLVGLAIHHAARIAAAACGGQIIVSDQVHVLAATLPAGVGLRALGLHRLRDVGTIALFQVAAPGLATEFAPLRTQGGSANNLPAPVTSLVGREAELAMVVDLLADHRLVTLTGAGGSGKTRLAMQVASTLGGRFPDGVWLVELAAVTAGDEVVGVLGEAIGLRGSAVEVLGTVRDAQMLIILDNCEHLLDACGSLAAELLAASPTLTVVATSREPLGIAGEVVFRVPSLSVPASDAAAAEVLSSESAMLFVERARLVVPGFEPSAEQAVAIGEICRRLDGIPLAIELAAARMRMLAPLEIAARLDDRFRLLTGGSRTALARQQTLLATVDWSFRLLTSAEQAVLIRFAVFQGGADLAAAEYVCSDDDTPQFEVLDLLAGLHDKSLLTRLEGDASRFRLPETIRQYATQRLLDGNGLTALRDRHADWYATCADDLVRSSKPGAVSRLRAMCDLDGDNLVAAAVWLVDHHAGRALHLLNQLTTASNFRTGLRWVAPLTKRCLEAAPDAPASVRAIASIFVSQSALFGIIDADVSAYRDEALRLLTLTDSPGATAHVLAAVAYQHIVISLQSADVDVVNRCLDAADRTGEFTTRFACRQVLELVAGFESGSKLSEEMIVLADDLLEPTLASVCRLNLSANLGFAGRSDEALALARSVSIGVDELVLDHQSLESALFLSLLEGEHGDLATGWQLAEDTHERVVSRPHYDDHAAWCLAFLARLRLLIGDRDGAAAAVAKAVPIFDAERAESFVGHLARITCSALRRGEGRYDEAADVLTRRLRTSTVGKTDWWFRSLEEGAHLAHAIGRSDVAGTLLATATHFRAALGKPLPPRCSDELASLVTVLADVPAIVVDPDAATSLVLSLAKSKR